MATTTDIKNTTFDSAVSILEMLPETQQKEVLEFSVKLLRKDRGNPFQPKSEEDFIKEIDLSLEQKKNGQTKDAFASLQNIADRIEQRAKVR